MWETEEFGGPPVVIERAPDLTSGHWKLSPFPQISCVRIRRARRETMLPLLSARWGARAIGRVRARAVASKASFSSSSSSAEPVGIVMLNMGGPSSLDGPVDGVEPFLRRLFTDGEIIKLGPLQKWLVSRAKIMTNGKISFRMTWGRGMAPSAMA